MVGIRVGGTNSGCDVGSTVAVAVGLGMGVNVAVVVAVAVDDGTGDGVTVTADPHAMNNKLITRKTVARKRFFIVTHFLGTVLDVLLPALFYRQGRFVGK
jgi:hypothetical protein